MSPLRRRALLAAAAAVGGAAAPCPALAGPAAPDDDRIAADRRLLFPRDHGAHNGARIEWWYATGWLQAPGPGTSTSTSTSTGTGTDADKNAAPGTGNALWGFQLTFFRSRTGLADGNPSRFAARHLLFAHAAVTQLATRRHAHDQRIARWSGAASAATGHAAVGHGEVLLADWSLRDEEPGDLGRAPATLSCDQLKVAVGTADNQRLKNAALADGLGQLAQCLFCENLAGLKGAGADILKWNDLHALP